MFCTTKFSRYLITDAIMSLRYVTLEHTSQLNPYSAFSNNSLNGFLMTGGMEYSAGLSKISAKQQ
jgi:hypothetical protein